MYYSTEEMAVKLRQTVPQIYRYAANGVIPGAVKRNGRWMFSKELVDDWLFYVRPGFMPPGHAAKISSALMARLKTNFPTMSDTTRYRRLVTSLRLHGLASKPPKV